MVHCPIQVGKCVDDAATEYGRVIHCVASSGIMGEGGGLILLGGVAGEAYAELFKDFAVDFAEHHGGMYLTACEFG